MPTAPGHVNEGEQVISDQAGDEDQSSEKLLGEKQYGVKIQ